MPLLHFEEYGDSLSQPSLVMIHGLMGASVNLRRIAKALSQDFYVLLPDTRNHGKSFWHDDMSYAAMAQDIEHLLQHLNISKTHLLGHSMGGKIAMQYALSYPKKTQKIIVADIAPRPYVHGHEHIKYLQIMAQMDMSVNNTRSAVKQQLVEQAHIADSTAQFLVQNLTQGDNGLAWRINIASIINAIATILEFPTHDIAFNGPSLFLHGGASDYVLPQDHPTIESLFPKAQYSSIENASHWLHAEFPDVFIERSQAFLKS